MDIRCGNYSHLYTGLGPEMVLGAVALMTAAAAISFTEYKELLKVSPAAVFATGLENPWSF